MSKVTRPILTGIFPRKRLFQLLDRLRKQPVIWVSGPPGSGQTTLVASYLQARKIPCLWYQADEGDSDPATFFYYMGQAAKKASPRKKKSLPLLTPEYLQGIPTFTHRYFENLSDRLKIPSILVFDNYQEVPSESPFHEIILNGLSRIPEGINVILISRHDPPRVLIRLRANQMMQMIGWDELRLTLEESAGVVRLRSKQKLSRETVRHLNESTDGWAAGLILMLEGARRGIEPQMLGNLTSEEIFDYFGKELFDKTDKEIQEFFLKTAILPKMTAKMAEALTDFPHAGRILSALSRNNYFTEKRIHAEPVYQYHSLFREFLLIRAKETFSRESQFILSRRAANLLEESSQTEAAISLLRDVSDWDRLVHLIIKHAPLMIALGRYRPLEDWLKSLPKEIMESDPWLLKIYTLGQFELLKDDKPIRFSRKAQQKPLSMLKALIAFGGREVREDQISDALWPEADGDVAYDSFKTTLHRLRKMVGYEKAIQLHEGRLTLDDKLCWVDVWAFEHVLEEAGTHWKDGLMDRAVQFTEKAIQMYKGPFLAKETEQPWTISMSERLRSKFLESVGRLGLYWQQAEHWEKAIECYQRGLELEDLAEEFYQGLMNCYQHLGQKTKVISLYNRCKRILSSTLGIEPSSKTEAIYRSLLSENRRDGDLAND